MIHKLKNLFKKNYLIDTSAIIYKMGTVVNNLDRIDAIEIGPHTIIKGELLTFGHGGKIKIGQYCYIGEYSKIWSAKSIRIGDRVLISHNVNIFDNSTHPISAVDRHKQYKEIISSGHPKKLNLQEKPIVIQNDVLIGCMSIILQGVTIGEGSIVGAGSVVTKDVPPWTIVAGNPTRVLRKIPENER
jgi:acetyltransferase-like isoleucine patch superfamily enzyme